MTMQSIRIGTNSRQMTILLAILWLAFGAIPTIGFSFERQDDGGEKLTGQYQSVEVTSDDMNDARTMRVRKESIKDYGDRPMRALQIPGHVLEAITSNMGTEFITID